MGIFYKPPILYVGYSSSQYESGVLQVDFIMRRKTYLI
jgi:hypothetical protein